MDKYFKVTERGSNFTTEILAGLTTWLTAAYIFAVNPNILSVTGLNFEGLVFATAMSSCIATLIMALWANLPFGLWPGMGMNAFFAYTVVGFKGTSQPVKIVMFAVMIEGLVFIIMSLVDLRRQIIKYFPTWLMKASMAGIGLFLAHIGMQAGNGIDLIKDHPAILVDVVDIFDTKHHGRTLLGFCMFLIMALLVLLRVRGAVMIAILMSAVLSWILAAAGNPAFNYTPMCCLGGVTFPPTGTAFPDNNGWYPKPGGGDIPKPTCVNPFTIEGTPSTTLVQGTDGADDFFTVSWDGMTVVENGFMNYTITAKDGTVTHHGGSLYYPGDSDGRNSMFKGACNEVCHGMFGGFNPSCFGSVLLETGCWSGLSPMSGFNSDGLGRNTMIAMGAMTYPAAASSDFVVVDGFGEGCLGGAGRIPKTFDPPTGVVAAPKIARAGPIVAPYPGWFACSTEGGSGAETTFCFAGNVQGGTIWAFDFEGMTFENFVRPLLTLLYVDFLGTMAFLYSAADLSGMIDPAKPHDFEGCYAAFMADAVGTFVGGFLGTSSVTTYGESMAGVYEGGRTGLTALTIAFFNFLAMFFAPLFSSIPTLATGPALMMVGVFMIEGVKDIDWLNYMEAIPALICIMLQPLTYKIEVGILLGLTVWAFLMLFSLRFALYAPAIWNALPPFLQKFVAGQHLSAKEEKLLAELGGAPGKSASVTATA